MNDPLSLQLYSVRNELSRDFAGSLRAVAEMGYTGVEFAWNYGGMEAPELKALLDSLGLRAISSHIDRIDELERSFDEQADFLEGLDCHHMVISFGNIRDEASALAHAERFRKMAERCAKRGFRFSYHHHSHEFAKTGDGRYLFDILMDACGEQVMAELDVYWIAFAGGDPAEVIRRYAGRVELMHLKQMGYVNGEKRDVHFNQGVLDLADLTRHARLAGVSEIIVEEEAFSEDMLDAVRTDIETFRRLG